MGGNLECQGGEGGVLVGGTGQLGLLVAYLVTGYVGHVQRAGQVVDDGVQYALHTLVLEGATGQNRESFTGDGQLTDTGLDFLNGEFFTFEVLLH